jgi:hypothetical protein
LPRFSAPDFPALLAFLAGAAAGAGVAAPDFAAPDFAAPDFEALAFEAPAFVAGRATRALVAFGARALVDPLRVAAFLVGAFLLAALEGVGFFVGTLGSWAVGTLPGDEWGATLPDLRSNARAAGFVRRGRAPGHELHPVRGMRSLGGVGRQRVPLVRSGAQRRGPARPCAR